MIRPMKSNREVIMMDGEEYKGNGYSGISMSNNALYAYSEGKKPLSKWKKKDIITALRRRKLDEKFIKEASGITLSALKKHLLYKAEYHHTSMRYNVTDFFDLIDITPDNQAELLQKMKNTQKLEKERKAEIKSRKQNNQSETQFRLVEIKFIRRSADGKHSWTVSGIGVIRGNWCYLKDKKRKQVTGKDFHITEELEELPADFELEKFYDAQYKYEVHKNY